MSRCPASKSLNVWRVLRKHRFFRWYRFSDYPGQFSIFQFVEWGVLRKHLCSGILGRFRVCRNQLPMSCFQVVEWRVLRKQRFLRWYRVSDYPEQFWIFQFVEWGVLRKHLCSGILGRFRVCRNQLPMSCFQVVEWRVLRKQRFLRWYRVSDYPEQFWIFQFVEWGVLRKHLSSGILGRFRVSRNHHPMSCFQVVEWRVLRKHRFFRWYRVSDHPGSFRSSKSLNGDFSGSIYILVIWCVSG